jgi:hypothetical protein
MYSTWAYTVVERKPLDINMTCISCQISQSSCHLSEPWFARDDLLQQRISPPHHHLGGRSKAQQLPSRLPASTPDSRPNHQRPTYLGIVAVFRKYLPSADRCRCRRPLRAANGRWENPPNIPTYSVTIS